MRGRVHNLASFLRDSLKQNVVSHLSWVGVVLVLLISAIYVGAELWSKVLLLLQYSVWTQSTYLQMLCLCMIRFSALASFPSVFATGNSAMSLHQIEINGMFLIYRDAAQWPLLRINYFQSCVSAGVTASFWSGAMVSTVTDGDTLG